MNSSIKFKNLIKYNRILNKKEKIIKKLIPLNNGSIIIPFTPLDPIVGYRNNIFFMIEYDINNNEFRVGIQKKSFDKMLKQDIEHPLVNFKYVLNKFNHMEQKSIIRSKYLIYASQISIKISELFENFINSNQARLKKNMFRGFQIRESFIDNRKYIMIIIKLFYDNNDTNSKNSWVNIEDEFITYMETNLYDSNYILASIYKQITFTKKESTNNDEYIEIYKKHDLIQKIDDMYFRISPGAFFQVNMFTAIKIYRIIKQIYIKEIKDRGLLINNINIFDICCGTGTIGLFLSNYSSKIYGFEINKNSITDCLFNSKFNNKMNTTYIQGPVEDTIYDIIHLLNKNEKLVPIINPPKRGLYPNVINILMKYYNNIEFIIYISCNPISFKKDYDILKAKYHISKIQLIDQFPLTNECEMVVLLHKNI